LDDVDLVARAVSHGPLLAVTVVGLRHKHGVKDVVQEVLVRAKQLDELLPLDLGETVNLVRCASLNDSQVSVQQPLVLDGLPRLLHFLANELESHRLTAGVDAVNEEVAQAFDLVMRVDQLFGDAGAVLGLDDFEFLLQP
jgi:hypothetical protein